MQAGGGAQPNFQIDVLKRPLDIWARNLTVQFRSSIGGSSFQNDGGPVINLRRPGRIASDKPTFYEQVTDVTFVFSFIWFLLLLSVRFERYVALHRVSIRTINELLIVQARCRVRELESMLPFRVK
jgi:hypothetical protein